MTDNTIYSTPPSRKTIKQNARRMLSNQDIIMKLVFATLICASVFVMLEYILSYALLEPIYYFFTDLGVWISFGIDQIYFIIEFLMFSPLVIGLYSLSAGLASGAEPELSRMFDYYRSFWLMCRSWAVSAIVVLPIKLYITLIEVAFTAELMNTFWGVILVFVFIVALISVMLLYGKLFTLINAFVCGKDQTLFSCIKVAMESTRGHLKSIFAFRISFLLWVLLSAATVGVLFIIFTIPYMAISYNHYSSYLITGEYRIHYSEEFNNE